MSAPHVIVCPSRLREQIDAISLADPDSIYLVVRDWGVGSKNKWLRAECVRGGRSFMLPLLIGRAIALFGVHVDHIVEQFDLMEALYGDDPEGGPETGISSFSARISLHRAALDALGIRLRGVRRGWVMERVPSSALLQAAE